MMDERSYVEFQALQTASGLVLVPFIDDLSVAIDTTRVTITHKGGLSLTPPAMPVADSPAALARGGAGPCYLDFASWSRLQGDSFLSTERRLTADIARLKPEDANHARLKLARFYLANGFAAETLGLIHLVQAADPALQSDRQLLTMRAASDLEMGRLRDAHNDIAGTAFDGKHLFQLAEDRILRIDPASGAVLGSIPAPGVHMSVRARPWLSTTRSVGARSAGSSQRAGSRT